MANGGFNHGSFLQPDDVSHSFVKKVVSKVSDVAGYVGKLFNSSSELLNEVEGSDSEFVTTSSDKRLGDAVELPASKRLKLPDNEVRCKTNFMNSDVLNCRPSTSGVYQSRNHVRSKCDDYIDSLPGPSGISSNTQLDLKINGDDQSETSGSTSGCSSLVPQSDRMSQSAFMGSKRRAIEEKLSNVRQQKNRSLNLDRSYTRALNDTKVHRFESSVYRPPALSSPSIKDRVQRPGFFGGQTSYGGGSTYRRAFQRSNLFNDSLNQSQEERRNKVQVKPTQESMENQSNMSQMAKKILEALEELSTPVKDAKRIPIGSQSLQNSKRKRLDESYLNMSKSRSPFTTKTGPPIQGLNVPTVPDFIKLRRLQRIQNSTAAARLVSVPTSSKVEYTLPDTEPDPEPSKASKGKIVTKLKDRDKKREPDPVVPVELPNVTLPIKALPKFDLSIPPTSKTAEPAVTIAPIAQVTTAKIAKPNFEKVKQVIPAAQSPTTTASFTFSPPISVTSTTSLSKPFVQTTFTFSSPTSPTDIKTTDKQSTSNLTNFMSEDAISKLKRKTISEPSNVESSFSVNPAKELKQGSVLDVLGVTKNNNNNTFGDAFKPAKDSWECDTCLVRNKSTDNKCVACESSKPGLVKPTPKSIQTNSVQGFGEQFKKKADQWECGTCMVRNENSAMKCVACETAKPGLALSSTGFGDQFKKKVDQWECPTCMIRSDKSIVKCPACETPNPNAVKVNTNFGDAFKMKSDQWECPTCMVRNTSTDVKCVSCETSKPGAEKTTTNTIKYNFEMPPVSNFKFGIDPKAAAVPVIKETSTGSTGFVFGAPVSSSNTPTPSVTTSLGTFTFGVPPRQPEICNIPEIDNSQKCEDKKPALAETPKPMFQFGINPQKPTNDEVVLNPSPAPFLFGQPNVVNETKKPNITNAFTFGAVKTETNTNIPAFSFNGAKTIKETKPFQFGQTNTNKAEEVKPSPGFGISSQPLVLNDNSKKTNSETKLNLFNAEKPAASLSFGASVNKNSETPPAFGQSFGNAANTFENKPKSVFGNTNTAITAPANPFSSSTPSIFNSNQPSSTPFSLNSPSTPFAFSANNSSPAPAFGSGATNTTTFGSFGSTTTDAPKPFTFNSTPTPITTSNSNIFSFGAASKPVEARNTFGQTNSAFSNSTPSPFGSYNTPKEQPPAFPHPAQPSFGQNTAPPAFGSNTLSTGFNFGGSASAPSQPAQPFSFTPNSHAFSTSIPSSFNFTGGNTVTFTAEPTERKIIKALRRTQR